MGPLAFILVGLRHPCQTRRFCIIGILLGGWTSSEVRLCLFTGENHVLRMALTPAIQGCFDYLLQIDRTSLQKNRIPIQREGNCRFAWHVAMD